MGPLLLSSEPRRYVSEKVLYLFRQWISSDFMIKSQCVKTLGEELTFFLRFCQEQFETRVSKEFQTEVDMLSQVEHLNLVRLIGYLEERDERILVTEYVQNGTLRQHLDGMF
jgi:hypothetical protein